MKPKLLSPFSSRQNMNTPDYELFYYADDRLERVSEHTHDYYELTFIVAGQREITIDGKKYACKSQDVILVLPGQAHDNLGRGTSGYERFVLWISIPYADRIMKRSEDLKRLFELAQSAGIHHHTFDFASFSTLCGLLINILEEKMRQAFGWQTIAANNLENLLLLWGREFFHLEEPASSPDSQVIDGVIAYIENHLSENLSLDHLSRRFYLSKFHLSRLFRQSLGISIHQYILKKRLKAASAGLLTSEDLSGLAQSCGFSDYSAFYRAFKKEYGVAPAVYREQIRNSLDSRTNAQKAEEWKGNRQSES